MAKTDVFYENIKTIGIDELIFKKKYYYYEVIQFTFLHIQNNKMLDILGINEMDMSVEILNVFFPSPPVPTMSMVL